MFDQYDAKAASASLQNIIARCIVAQQTKQLTTALKDKEFFQSLQVVMCGDPPRHRLVTKDQSQNGSLEEVVLFIQGILCEKNLPPLEALPRSRSSRSRKYLQQGVAITGASLSSFDDNLPALRTIQSIFSACLPAYRFDNFPPSLFKDHFSFTANNRYFTAAKEITSTTVIPFPTVVDPHGTMQAMLSQDIVYAADNVVQYYKINKQGVEIFDPAKFCLGDIVEIQVSFMAVGSHEQYRMKTILRSIALLDNSHSQNARLAHSFRQIATETDHIVQHKTVVKRHVGYNLNDNQHKKGSHIHSGEDISMN